MISYLCLAAMVLLTAAGQILVKLGATGVEYGAGPRAFFRSLWRWPLLAGAVAVLAAPVFYFVALARVPLSLAYPFTGFTYVLVLLGSAWILGERLRLEHAAGVALIFLGIALFGMG